MDASRAGDLFKAALDRRAPLLDSLVDTDCLRLLHLSIHEELQRQLWQQGTGHGPPRLQQGQSKKANARPSPLAAAAAGVGAGA